MARRRSYARRAGGQGPPLPGFEDCLVPAPEIRGTGDRQAPASSPAAIDARAILALHELGQGELLPLLAIVTLRAGGSTWRATQAQVARALGMPLRTLQRHEARARSLGLLELEGQGTERRVRVLHKVVHKLSTTATGGGSVPPSVAGRLQVSGTHARADSELLRADPSYLHVRARTRRATGGPTRPHPLALDELVAVAGLWPNVLAEVRGLGRELEEAWGVEPFARYCSNLAGHLAQFDEGRRGGMALGSLRTRASKVRAERATA